MTTPEHSELHGGHAWVYLEGATFTARLPLLRDTEPRRHMRPLPEAAPIERAAEGA